MDVTVANCNKLDGGKVVLDNVVMCANVIVLLTAQSSVRREFWSDFFVDRKTACYTHAS